MSEKGYRMTATGMEPLGTVRDVRVRICRFDALPHSKPATHIS